MNKRIKELAEQSELWRMLEEYSWEFGSCDPEKDCGRIEKFAELIVRECIGMILPYNEDDPSAERLYELSDEISEHFGVES